jgi:hypothetical protein
MRTALPAEMPRVLGARNDWYAFDFDRILYFLQASRIVKKKP